MPEAALATREGSPEDLLIRMASGDRAAFRAFYEATNSRLFPVAQAILRDRDRAADVLQDAYLRIFERAFQFRSDKGSALAWAITITRRLALNAIRRSPAAMVSIDDHESAFEIADDTLPAISEGFEPRLGPCMDALPARQREAVVLAYVLGLTHEELAERLGTPLGTVKSWVRRGLEQLKECLR
jgi:RNA polymerase sigma-70 factor, ECF subfamily